LIILNGLHNLFPRVHLDREVPFVDHQARLVCAGFLDMALGGQ